MKTRIYTEHNLRTGKIKRYKKIYLWLTWLTGIEVNKRIYDENNEH